MTPADLRRALNIPSFFTMPDLEHLSSRDSVISQLAKAALVLSHTESGSASLEGRCIDLEAMKARSLARLAENPAQELDPMDRLLLFCVQVEEGKADKAALQEAFKHLDEESRNFIETRWGKLPDGNNEFWLYGFTRAAFMRNPKGATLIEELLEYNHEKQALVTARSELRRLQRTLRERLEGWEEEAHQDPRWRLLGEYAAASSLDPKDPATLDKLITEVESLTPVPSEEVLHLEKKKKAPAACEAIYALLTSIRFSQIEELVQAKLPLLQILKRLNITESREFNHALRCWFGTEDIPSEEKRKALTAIVSLVDNDSFLSLLEVGLRSLGAATKREEFELKAALLATAARTNAKIDVMEVASPLFQSLLNDAELSPEERFNALATLAPIIASRKEYLEGAFFKNIFSIEGISSETKLKAMASIALSANDIILSIMLGVALPTLKELTDEQRFDIRASLLSTAVKNPRVTSEVLCTSLDDRVWKLGENRPLTLAERLPAITPRKTFDTLVSLCKCYAQKGTLPGGNGNFSMLPFLGIGSIEGISEQEKFEALTAIAKISAAAAGKQTSENFEVFGIYDCNVSGEEDLRGRTAIAKIALMNHPESSLKKYGIPTEKLEHFRHIQFLSRDEMLTEAPWIHDLCELNPAELAPEGSSVRRILEEEASLDLERGSPAWKRRLLHRAMALYCEGSDVDLLLSKIMEYRNPQKSAYFFYLLSNIIPSLPLYEELAKEMTLDGQRASLRYPLLFITDIAREAKLGAATDQLRSIAKNIDASFKVLKDATKMGVFLNLLQSLHQNTALTPEEKLSLLDRLFAGKRGKEWFSKVSILSALFALSSFQWEWPSDLPREFTLEDLIHKLSHSLNLPEFDIEKYITLTSSQKRRPFGLETYLAGLSSLHDPVLTPCIQKFFSCLLGDTFKGARYEAEGNPHLEKLQCDHPELWEKWLSLPGCDFSAATLRAREMGRTLGSRASSLAFMKQKLITDAHLPNLATAYPHLHHYLKPEAPSAPSTPITNFEKLCLSLCRATTEEEEHSALTALNALMQHDSSLKRSEWAHDVQDRLKGLAAFHSARESSLVFTDAWQDLLLSGTEVLGSCQRLDGDPTLNKCLLSYCMDGKIMMIAAIDPTTQHLRARALLKLLFVEKSPGVLTPALFLERIYPFGPPAELVHGINQMAKEAAAHLGIPLYSINPSLNLEAEEVALHSLASNAPYEYSDASQGVTSGAYSHGGKKVSRHDG